ncbi:BTB/POZ domain-containing protein 9-like isoform X3 [Zophobas morio]|uniref:BTB/POZ domain-containing protein 9-like isoform X3 n=1 Tax=Zophobas morio TaxID=2755281 RepID=UPI0030831AF1
MANEAEPQQKIIITDSSKMYEDMSPYYLRETFSDIQLILPDKTIHAHKIVLAARCKYFESLLMKDPKQVEITLRNVPSKAFETILYYIYTGSIVIASEDENDISDILQLAHEYSLKTLEKSINEKMNSIVNLSNVCSLLNKANAHDMDELRQICHTFIDEHVSQTLEYDFFNVFTQKSIINLLKRDAFPVEEINVFKIVYNWCKINKDLNKLVIECIRISTLTRNEILTVVWPSKIVDEAKLLNALAAIEVNGPKATQRRYAGRLKDKNLATADNVKVISGLNTAMFFEETEKYEEGAYHNEDDKNGITVDLGAVKCFNYITMYVIIKGTSDSFRTYLYLNQPYMISQIKVRLQFYKSISSIETSCHNSPWKRVELPINENVLLRFNERVVNLIEITGQLSPNKTKDHVKQFLEDFECF